MFLLLIMQHWFRLAHLSLLDDVVRVTAREASTLQQIHHITLTAITQHNHTHDIQQAYFYNSRDGFYAHVTCFLSR